MAYKSGVCKMNADKLLEDLREIDLFNVDSVNYGNKKHYIDQLESMLRQQQAEIEELKAKLQLHEAMDNQCASLMQQFRKASEK